ncbi:MAG: nuclear transport factor 2 family protein [Myxococcales bacterium]|nr:nuclear transport factor 2 family protein [Myxococcales bacterium]
MRERAAENLAVLKKCFAIIGTGDADALVEHYTDDYVLELPYATTDGTTRYEGRDAVRARLRLVFRVLRLNLRVTVVHPAADPDLVIAEYTSEGTSLPTGERTSNRYVGFWWFRDGLACRTREYFNPELSVTKSV